MISLFSLNIIILSKIFNEIIAKSYYKDSNRFGTFNIIVEAAAPPAEVTKKLEGDFHFRVFENSKKIVFGNFGKNFNKSLKNV